VVADELVFPGWGEELEGAELGCVSVRAPLGDGVAFQFCADLGTSVTRLTGSRRNDPVSVM
jgi:hypothetical protein